MTYLLLFELLYFIFLLAFALRVIYDTDDTPKTLAYLMLIIFVPLFGMIFYIFFGMNFRKRNLFNKKQEMDEANLALLHDEIRAKKEVLFESGRKEVMDASPLIRLLVNDGLNPVMSDNSAKLLLNGEQKFPELFAAIASAKHHVHLVYYIVESDNVGNELLDLLIRKVREGVSVRLLYDDFGSRPIRGSYVQKLRDAGGEAVGFNKIKIFFFASKINYRNHRKIAVIDGEVGYIGGINISDKYINSGDGAALYWRDTHLEIRGKTVDHLQHIFLSDWTFSSGQKLTLTDVHRPKHAHTDAGIPIQIVSGGPDCPRAIIRFSMLQAIHLAKRNLYITTPYFIPDNAIISALKVSALSGVDVRLLVPEVSDSLTVNAAARSYYLGLVEAGVSVYLYQKGFVHAKTMVIDRQFAVIGTANMDIRSFDINFEVNANVYDMGLAGALEDAFLEDINGATLIDEKEWRDRSLVNVIPERIARLFSPLL